MNTNSLNLTYLAILSATVVIALVHVMAGPDHYVPFIALARALGWSRAKTFLIVLIAGIAHVASSFIIGSVGLVLGLTLTSLRWLEGVRGEVAGWLLILAGLLYLLWALRRRAHHHHRLDDAPLSKKAVLFWVLIVIFVLGPCEPLVPLMFAAVQLSWLAVMASSLIFLVLTVVMMEIFVLAGAEGLRRIPLRLSERMSQVVASLVIVGLGIVLMLIP